MKGSHSSITPATLDSLWALPRTKADWLAAIEEIIERGPTCIQFVADELKLPAERVGDYIRSMIKEGIIEKQGRMTVGKVWHKMYGIPSACHVQATLMHDPASRDWLVAAFFGEYKPCV